MSNESKFCKHCGTEHLLTKEFWYINKAGTQCKSNWNIKRKKLFEENPTLQKERNQAAYKKNGKSIREDAKKYRLKNPEKVKQWDCERAADSIRKKAHINQCYQRKKQRLKEDPYFRVVSNLRRRMHLAVTIGSGYGSLMMYIGCERGVLIESIEKKFKDGMTWKNYGDWHLDHIVPLDSFDLAEESARAQAFHYANLQPLWAIDNIIKSNKVQP